MKNRIKKYFSELLDIPSASGAEQRVIQYMYDHLIRQADTIAVSTIGNLRAEIQGASDGPKLMICSHADEVGFIVKNILDNGFLIFEKLGGISDAVIPGRNVIVGSGIHGVTGVRPAHIRPDTANKNNGTLSSYIDIGAFSRNEAEEMGVHIGDRVVYDAVYRELGNGDVICSRGVDNKISLAILIVLFEELANKKFCGSVTAGISVQEEFSLKGAGCLAEEVKPDYSIVLDTIPAGDTPDVCTEKELPVYLGKGPACPLADGFISGIHHTAVNLKVQEFIDSAAQSTDIHLQHLTMIGESYLTDASAIAYAGKGIPVGILAIPRRYSHSPVEVFHMNDSVNALRLLTDIVQKQDLLDLRFIEI